MTRIAGDNGFADDWDAMRSDGDIQFAPVEAPDTPPSEPPDWLQDVFSWLGDVLEPVGRAIGAAWPVIFWILVAIGLALIGYAIYRLVDPARFARRRRSADNSEWVPEEAKALELLEEADRLARDGRFDEATHLLLMRSVGQIAEIRPDLIDPSSTAREIAALPALPGAARTAFATIAERVERSLFALSSLSDEDWQAARSAYSDFALGYRGVRS